MLTEPNNKFPAFCSSENQEGKKEVLVKQKTTYRQASHPKKQFQKLENTELV